jgi:hypothetical protein
MAFPGSTGALFSTWLKYFIDLSFQPHKPQRIVSIVSMAENNLIDAIETKTTEQRHKAETALH